MLKRTLLFQWQQLNLNRVTFFILCVICLIILYMSYTRHTIAQGVAYLLVMYVCALITDLYSLYASPKNEWMVRNPRKEAWLFVGSTLLGMIFLIVRYASGIHWDTLHPIIKLSLIPLMLFVFPIALAIMFLFMKYKPADLGLRFQGLIVVLPIVFLCAITSYVVSPQAFTWNALLESEGGIAGVLFNGFIVAGLSEEFFRVIGQTRIGALLQNKGIGWLLATLLWASLHAPKWYGDSHDWNEAIFGVIRIMPIGLMWGYVTHRTKSFLPSVLIHGMNVWGIQNF